MSQPESTERCEVDLECSHCGGVAISSKDGKFYDGDGEKCSECGFPGHVSADEDEAYWVPEENDGLHCDAPDCIEGECELIRLRRALAEAEKAKREAENEMVAAESQLEWLSDAITGARPIDDYGLSFGVVREAVDLRTRAEATEGRLAEAEKARDEWKRAAESHAVDAARLEGRLKQEARNLELVVASKGTAEERAAQAEQRNTELERALRPARLAIVEQCRGEYIPTDLINGLLNRIDAALHDEERSAPSRAGPRAAPPEAVSLEDYMGINDVIRGAQGEEK